MTEVRGQRSEVRGLTCRTERLYGRLVVAGEGVRPVVHDAADVVGVGGEALVPAHHTCSLQSAE